MNWQKNCQNQYEKSSAAYNYKSLTKKKISGILVNALMEKPANWRG